MTVKMHVRRTEVLVVTGGRKDFKFMHGQDTTKARTVAQDDVTGVTHKMPGQERYS